MLTFFYTRSELSSAGMRAQWDENGGRILLGDNTSGRPAMLWSIRFLCAEVWILTGLPRIYIHNWPYVQSVQLDSHVYTFTIDHMYSQFNWTPTYWVRPSDNGVYVNECFLTGVSVEYCWVGSQSLPYETGLSLSCFGQGLVPVFVSQWWANLSAKHTKFSPVFKGFVMTSHHWCFVSSSCPLIHVNDPNIQTIVIPYILNLTSLSLNGSTAPWWPRRPHFSRLHDHTQTHHVR
jgi:hypothetical protein